MIPLEQLPARIEISGASEAERGVIARHLVICILLCLLPIILAWDSMRAVLALVLENDTYTHIPLIPAISTFLIYVNRRATFSRISFNWTNGLILLLPGAIAIISARLNTFQLRPSNQMSLIFLGLVIMWVGAFAQSWGTTALMAARFPLLFLIFMIPIPEPLLSKVVLLLQEWSADATAGFFSLFGIPFLRDHLVFSLPGIAIRVAEECSGIRSTLALMIMMVLASHLFLKTTWKQFVVCLLVLPLSIIKNGLRIATLSTLAVYVDQDFLTGPIHHEFGGMLFFGAAFIPLVLVFRYFQKTERKSPAVRDHAS